MCQVHGSCQGDPVTLELEGGRTEGVGVTFEDIVLYFSREEWSLLDEGQRQLYLNVMLENFELLSLLGCCCGEENVEAPTEQKVSVRMSQARNPNVALSSQKSHPCESCELVLGNIFHLTDLQRTQHGQILLRCGACAKRFYFSAKFYQHHVREKLFIRGVERNSCANSFDFNVSQNRFTCGEVGQGVLTRSGPLHLKATQTRDSPTAILTCGMTFERRNNYYSRIECKEDISCIHTFIQEKCVHLGSREVKLEKSLITAVNVENILPGSVIFTVIREFIQEKSLIHAVSVENLLHVAVLSNIIKEFTLEKCLINAVNFIREKSLINAMNVENLLNEEKVSNIIREFTGEKSLINAFNVENLLQVALVSNIIREFTLEKSLISAVNVENLLPLRPSFINIREFIPEKSLIIAVNVENLLHGEMLSNVIRAFTLEKSLINAVNVENLLPVREYFIIIIREFTQEKSLINAVNVENLLHGAMLSNVIREFTLEKSLINVVNVGNIFLLVMTFIVTREFIQEKSIINAMNAENLLFF
ncbi:hypothetical protein QTO34_014181 [Cnephaeus nilssonii]|uniref:KRAB domain-containing protein n=1 Tax=Cnephaeus nilssonii TaxID=3371016 RepID=A0AA40LCA9_CNENI|nr:hypothetical protein QTO34_014181 [Eptesicus nilssonii]